MDHKFQSGASATPPTAFASPSGPYPTPGNGSSIPATLPGAYWYYMITEELRNVVDAAGITPDHTVVTQLLAALNALYLPISGPAALSNMTVTSTAESLPAYICRRPDTSPTVADFVAQFAGYGRNSVAADTLYGDLLVRIVNKTAGAESGEIVFRRPQAGTLVEAFCMRAGLYANGLSDGGLGTGNFTDILVNNVSAVVPAGAVLYFPTATAPSGYLKCNGAAVSRTTYAALFAVIGTAYGAGDGSTTFNVPDNRGLFIRGYHDGHTTYETDTGRAIGSYQADAFASHTHTFDRDSAGAGGSGGDAGNTATGTRTTNATGGAETRGRNIALLAVIKY